MCWVVEKELYILYIHTSYSKRIQKEQRKNSCVKTLFVQELACCDGVSYVSDHECHDTTLLSVVTIRIRCTIMSCQPIGGQYWATWQETDQWEQSIRCTIMSQWPPSIHPGGSYEIFEMTCADKIVFNRRFNGNIDFIIWEVYPHASYQSNIYIIFQSISIFNWLQKNDTVLILQFGHCVMMSAKVPPNKISLGLSMRKENS